MSKGIVLRHRNQDEYMVAPFAEPFPGFESSMIADIAVDGDAEYLLVHQDGIDITCDEAIFEFRTQSRAVLDSVLKELSTYVEAEDLHALGFQYVDYSLPAKH